jgi:hypothetical protein
VIQQLVLEGKVAVTQGGDVLVHPISVGLQQGRHQRIGQHDIGAGLGANGHALAPLCPIVRHGGRAHDLTEPTLGRARDHVHLPEPFACHHVALGTVEVGVVRGEQVWYAPGISGHLHRGTKTFQTHTFFRGTVGLEGVGPETLLRTEEMAQWRYRLVADHQPRAQQRVQAHHEQQQQGDGDLAHGMTGSQYRCSR